MTHLCPEIFLKRFASLSNVWNVPEIGANNVHNILSAVLHLFDLM